MGFFEVCIVCYDRECPFFRHGLYVEEAKKIWTVKGCIHLVKKGKEEEKRKEKEEERRKKNQEEEKKRKEKEERKKKQEERRKKKE